MREATTSERLKEIINDRNLRQVDILEKVKPYCEMYGEKINKSHLSQWVSGTNEPNQKKLHILSIALGVSEAWLMGYSDEKEAFGKTSRFDKVLAYSKSNNIPLSELMDGRDIQPCDYENITNARVHEVMRNYDKRVGELSKNNLYLNKEHGEQLIEMIDLFTSATDEQKDAVITLLRSFKN